MSLCSRNSAKRWTRANRWRAASNICSHANERGKLVWPLGAELYLWHVVVLCALNTCGLDRRSVAPQSRRLARRIQNADGGWGEDGASYRLDYRGHEPAASTASQTAWALLGLMAGGEIDHPAVSRGIRYLSETQTGTDSGTKSDLRRPGFHAFSTCVITDTENFSRFGRSRAIEI